MTNKKLQIIYGKNYEEARQAGLVGDLVISEFDGASEWNTFKHRHLAKALDYARDECESQIMSEARRTRADYVFMKKLEYVLGCPQDSAGPVWIYAELGRLGQADEPKETIKNAFNHR